MKATGALRDAIHKAERYKEERDQITKGLEELDEKLKTAKVTIGIGTNYIPAYLLS